MMIRSSDSYKKQKGFFGRRWPFLQLGQVTVLSQVASRVQSYADVLKRFVQHCEYRVGDVNSARMYT